MEYKINNSEMFGISIIRQDGDLTTVIQPIEGSVEYEQYLIDTDGGLPLPEEQA